MSWEAEIELHSINENGKEIMTAVLTYPRIVLAETYSHRMLRTSEEIHVSERSWPDAFAKNTSSSRAIPFEMMVRQTVIDPYIPQFTKNKPGMSGDAIEEDGKLERLRSIWLSAMRSAVEHARELAELGVHKQDVNRLIEPWSWITQVVTSTSWPNFFALRCGDDAHPAMRRIARMLYLKYRNSTPILVTERKFHIPFVSEEEKKKLDIVSQLHVSAARAARVSYKRHKVTRTVNEEIEFTKNLIKNKHWSPLEHQAMSHGDVMPPFRGWVPWRKLFQNEEITKFCPSEEEVQKWIAECNTKTS